jgi:hypothetical protein
MLPSPLVRYAEVLHVHCAQLPTNHLIRIGPEYLKNDSLECNCHSYLKILDNAEPTNMPDTRHPSLPSILLNQVWTDHKHIKECHLPGHSLEHPMTNIEDKSGVPAKQRKRRG